MKIYISFLVVSLFLNGCVSVQENDTESNRNIEASDEDNVISYDDIDKDKYRPIVRVAPRFPKEAVKNNIEGWVIVEFEVDTKGKTKNHRIKSNSGVNTFDRAAIATVSKFLYKPYVLNGKVYSISGVRNKIKYKFR